ncbi:MAG: SUMF1/EgtB/PvdO family nonheme iron enzyme [Planctomycetaceae bacterium]|nr:SUMF1/EgtB/PvdO family nonheme iron enzyme [Planctomycetaceae bacterium]
MRSLLQTTVGNWKPVALLIAFILCGCGGGSEPPKTPGPVVPPPEAVNPAPATPAPVNPVAADPGAADPAAANPDPGSPAVEPAAAEAPPENPVANTEESSPPPVSSDPASAPTASTTPTTSTIEGGEAFALVGKPNEQEYFKLQGNDDGQEEVSVSVLPENVDGTMFRVTGSSRDNNITPSSNGPRQNLPEDVQALPEFGYSPDGLPYRIRLLTNDPVEMALVPAGEFIRGKSGEEPELSPQQTIYLDSFYMDLTEVTVERYVQVKEAMTKAKRTFTPPSNHQGASEAAAVGIGYGDAQFYAKWAGKELPTEAQWEKAARGTAGARYPWGNGRPIWNRMRKPGQIDRVGTFSTDISPYGILDLAGNAREWCRDNYSPKAYAEIGSTPSKLRNPIYSTKLSGESVYVVRGGSEDWSVWARGHSKGTSRYPTIGFRCVYQIPAAKSP